jgi:hypothetical protein
MGRDAGDHADAAPHAALERERGNEIRRQHEIPRFEERAPPLRARRRDQQCLERHACVEELRGKPPQ